MAHEWRIGDSGSRFPVRAASSQGLGLFCVRNTTSDGAWCLFRFSGVDLVPVHCFTVSSVSPDEDTRLAFLGESSSKVVVLCPQECALLVLDPFTGEGAGYVGRPGALAMADGVLGLAVSSSGTRVAAATTQDYVSVFEQDVFGEWALARNIRTGPQPFPVGCCSLAFAHSGRYLGILRRPGISGEGYYLHESATWTCADLASTSVSAPVVDTRLSGALSLFVSKDCCFYGHYSMRGAYALPMVPGACSCCRCSGSYLLYDKKVDPGCGISRATPAVLRLSEDPNKHQVLMLPGGMGCAAVETPALNQSALLRQLYVPVRSEPQVAWMGTVCRAKRSVNG